MAKVKLGKYKNCIKKMKRYGLSQKESEIACSRYLVGDDEWSVEWTSEKKKKKKTGFETEEEEKKQTGFETEKPKKEKKEKVKFTPAGGKAIRTEPEKRRPVVFNPKAFQLPLFQPWRAPKSEHRLQTKLEKIQTQEQKYLTMEQLMRRKEYAVAIKKRDSGELEIILPSYITDEIVADAGRKAGPFTRGTGSGRRMKPQEEKEVQWITTKGGKKVPISEPGKEKTSAEAVKEQWERKAEFFERLEKRRKTQKETAKIPKTKQLTIPTAAESRKLYRERMGEKTQTKTMMERYIEHKERSHERKVAKEYETEKEYEMKLKTAKKTVSQVEAGNEAVISEVLEKADNRKLVELALKNTKNISQLENIAVGDERDWARNFAFNELAKRFPEEKATLHVAEMMASQGKAKYMPYKVAAKFMEQVAKDIEEHKKSLLTEDVPIEKITQKEVGEKAALEAILGEFEKELEELPPEAKGLGKKKKSK